MTQSSISKNVKAPPVLPAPSDFVIEGTFLNSAFTHPISLPVSAAMDDYVNIRRNEADRIWFAPEIEREAAAAFARLINTEPDNVAIVPSTMAGENLINASLGLRSGERIVTDAFHFYGSLSMYREMRKSGVDVVTVQPCDNSIELSDIDEAISHDTRLVAVSLVSSHMGYVHDLKAICEIAHRKGVPVYADIMQAAGAIPIDVQQSGVDFACCGGYKWLQGDFGAAFLYVRPESLGRLRRVQSGWRQALNYTSHVIPFNPPGPPEGSWEDAPGGVRSIFEISSTSHLALWTLRASIDYVLNIGLDAIQQHRRRLMDKLYEGMSDLEYVAVTPREHNSSIATFARPEVGSVLQQRCADRKITVGVGPNFVRISPSIFNTVDDIELMLEAAKI